MAFEPDPRLTKYLEEKLGVWENVRFYPLAVFAESTSVTFNLSPMHDEDTFKNTGSSSLLNLQKQSKNFYSSQVTVEATKLNDIEQISEVEIDLIWIDIQGAEKVVVNSHTEVFFKTKLIWIEYGEVDYSDFYLRDELIQEFSDTHSVSVFSNQAEKGNLLLVKK